MVLNPLGMMHRSFLRVSSTNYSSQKLESLLHADLRIDLGGITLERCDRKDAMGQDIVGQSHQTQ